MDDLTKDIAGTAAVAVRMAEARGETVLDFSEASLQSVEEMLAEAAEFVEEIPEEDFATLVQNFGCYLMEVGRKEFGGRYYWLRERNQPVLVVGEPDYRVAMLGWEKVRGRLSGDEGDNIPFFYAGFAKRSREATSGDDVLYV